MAAVGCCNHAGHRVGSGGTLGRKPGRLGHCHGGRRLPGGRCLHHLVSGSGVSVAEQQIYNIEAESRAAGLSEHDIAKAVLFGRLLIDWQLVEPLYRQANEDAARDLAAVPGTSSRRWSTNQAT